MTSTNWNELSRRLGEKHYEKTGAQAKNKWNNLATAHRATRDYYSTPGAVGLFDPSESGEKVCCRYITAPALRLLAIVPITPSRLSLYHSIIAVRKHSTLLSQTVADPF
jgi:hypothetical protein